MSDLQPLFGWKTKSNEDSLLKVQRTNNDRGKTSFQRK